MLVVGLGAAGVAVTKMMLASGVTHIVGCDRQGALSTEPRGLRVRRDDRDQALVRGELQPRASSTGRPADVIEGMDLFVGLSGPGIIEAEALAKMNDDAIVFAMANPTPEVMPEDAAPYVRIMATGRSDYPNQINNVLCLPGHLPRRPRRRRPADHRGDEAGRRQGHRRGRSPRRTSPRTTSSPASSTATSPRGRRGGGRGGEARRDRPVHRGDRDLLDDRVEAAPRRCEGPRHRRQRLHRLGALRRAAGPRRRGRRPDPRPGAGAQHEPDASPGTPGSRPWNGRRRRPSRASTASSTWSARRSTSAGPTRPSSGSWRAAAPAPTTSSARSPALERKPSGAGQPVGGRLLRRPRRRRSSTSRPRPATGFDAEVVRDWEEAAREVESARRAAGRSSAPASCSTPAAACWRSC